MKIVALVLLATSIAPGPSAAREGTEDRKITVQNRPRPELDPLGARLGSFLFFPEIGLGAEYTDNVYKTEDDPLDDFVLHLLPGGRLASDWNSHALEIGFRADVAMYAENGSEDYEDIDVWLDGRLDVTRSTSLFAGVRFESLHEDRGSPDEVSGRRPTTFDRATASIGVSQRLNRATLEAEATAVQLDFDDVRALDGSVINNDDRDRDVYLGSVKLGYEVVPHYLAFIRGTFNRRDYGTRLDDFGFDRDSFGYDLAVGTELDLTGVTFGEVHFGYRQQVYEDSRFDTVDGVSFGARLTSTITPLTTLQFVLEREIEETSMAAAEGYWWTSARLTADHELLRNLIVSADLGYALSEYKGIDRQDDLYTAGFGAEYQLNRNLGFTAGYRFEERDSSGSAGDDDYVENLFLMRVTGRL